MLYEIYNGGKFISRGVGTHITRKIESDELIYVLRGRLSMFEEEKRFFLTAGEFLFLRRSRTHGGIEPYGEDLIFFWLHFKDLDHFLDSYPQSGKIHEEAFLSNYLQNFLIEQNRYKVDEKISDLLFQLIMREIYRSSFEDISRKRTVTPLGSAAKEQLFLHFKEESFSLASAAEALQCNTEYLGRIFHSSFGETFNSLLNKKRLEFASALLRETVMSIKEVAQSSGFHDVCYFHRRFLVYYGITPSRYRATHSACHKNTQ